MKRLFLVILPLAFILSSCGSGGSDSQQVKSDVSMESKQVKLITVDPGHFHAALVQKSMYEQVSPDVHVYAPDGPDITQHLNRINGYNTRTSDPTAWNEIVYKGDDFFDKMLSDQAGNVVVLSGNNKKKAEYITRSVNAGLNVLADKPMIIRFEDFQQLEDAFKAAEQKGVLLYDIMTERFEITTLLQKTLSMNSSVFGTLVNGTEKEPAVTKVSVHHFSKLVSGSPLIRPAWFFDVEQQGEGLVDITTHLVDLVQWECFSEQVLSPADVKIVAAKRWPTLISQEEFRGVTGLETFPDYLVKDVKDGKVNVYSNGEMIYSLKGVFAKISVEWKYQAPPGGGDTHYSTMRGTQCDLTIKQGPDEKYLPTLYLENIKGLKLNEMEAKLKSALTELPYDSLSYEKVGANSFKINVLPKYRVSHEEHFAQVTSKYLGFLKDGKMPDWEVPGMITKYYTTTSALSFAKGK
ncbi:MAG: oxidoreductase [Bacteroidetes bacterium]|nr:oxidoreductase [Bacteroidota bacterium]